MFVKYVWLPLSFALGNKIPGQLDCKMRGAKPREQIMRKAIKLLTSLNYAYMDSPFAFISLYIRYNRVSQSIYYIKTAYCPLREYLFPPGCHVVSFDCNRYFLAIQRHGSVQSEKCCVIFIIP